MERTLVAARQAGHKGPIALAGLRLRAATISSGRDSDRVWGSTLFLDRGYGLNMPEPLDGAVDAAVHEELLRHVPGVSVALVRPGGVEWSSGFGLADIVSRRRTGSQTSYVWFSMTKIVTATAVLQLVDQGKLDLNDEVATRLPEFADVFRPLRGTAATLKHLLSHSAGLANPIPVAWVHNASAVPPDQTAFTRKLLAKNPRLKSPPGARAT